MNKKISQLSPGRMALGAISLVILLGTLLLALPASQTRPIPLLDLLFTATSATCVTGLFTVSLADFTFFGQCILLALIQIGGLGLITMTLFFASFFVELGLSTQLMAGKLLDIESWSNSKRIIAYIIGFTLIAECLGALIMWYSFSSNPDIFRPWFLAFFYAISSFCHAGVILAREHGILFAHSPLILICSMLLMLAGGLGFITWKEIGQRILAAYNNRRIRFSLQTKIILYSTLILSISSSIIFWLLERNHSLAATTPTYTILYTLFNVIAARGAGMITVQVSQMQLATLFIIMALAFIGAAPGSTGSGIKLTTFALYLATIKAAITGKTSVEIRGRSIPLEQIYKVIAIVSIGIFWIAGSTFLLLITESEWQFFDILFEAASAFTTLGVSTGITPHLSILGKLIIITSMIVGRIGSLTLILALKLIMKRDRTEFSYPQERVMLG